jgi:hypothetical protein
MEEAYNHGGGVFEFGGYAYFDEDIWEQRDGPSSVPYRRKQ